MKDSILLSELFTKDFDDLPSWVNSKRVIYQIHNLINNKSYIGQAKTFLQRLVYGGIFSHKHCYDNPSPWENVIYRALHKYGADKFEVFILESNVEDLNSAEKYWIAELHTYIHDPLGPGYNMTKGGEDCSQLNSPESIARREDTKRKLREEWLKDPKNVEAEHEAVMRRCDVQRANHDGYMPFNTPEHYERMKEERGGDYMAACHTEEARSKKLDNERVNHKGVLAFNTEEQIEALVQRNKDPELIEYSKLGRLFTDLYKVINQLKDKGLDLNYENFSNTPHHYTLSYYLKYLSAMQHDERWLDHEAGAIFKDFINK